VFCQSHKMIEIIGMALTDRGWTYQRVDSTVAPSNRVARIDKFNDPQSDVFCMLATTRVGGVGVNLVGANRLVLFDPEWNPQIDQQARERAWRIGQTKEVLVYRLVLGGSLEEAIYSRQAKKNYLATKVLDDVRVEAPQDYHVPLFALPPKPPNYTPSQASTTSYDAVVRDKVQKGEPDKPVEDEDDAVILSTEAEHNDILEKLYATGGVKAERDQDKVEHGVVDLTRKRTAHVLCKKAYVQILRSAEERRTHDFDVPTWTGSEGRAGRGSLANGTKKAELLSHTELRDLLRQFFSRQKAATTGEIVDAFAQSVSQAQQGTFKHILQDMCYLTEGTEGRAAQWQLKQPSSTPLVVKKTAVSPPKPTAGQPQVAQTTAAEAHHHGNGEMRVAKTAAPAVKNVARGGTSVPVAVQRSIREGDSVVVPSPRPPLVQTGAPRKIFDL